MTHSNHFVLRRFALKCAMLTIFAALQWRWGFIRTIALLSGFSAIMAAAIALYNNEDMRKSRLTYWDEAAAFIMINSLAVLMLIWRSS